MTINRRQVITGAGVALGAPFLMTDRARAAEVTLRLHHFLPPVSNAHKNLLVPWTKQVADASQGRIKIDIFPAMQLGGTPPQLYDQARDGVADIIWTLPGSTPGRFPTTEALELPFIAAETATVNAQAAQELADAHLKDEVADVKLLCYWAHDAGHIHSKRKVSSMADLKGMKLRNGTRLSGEALKALGAVSVGMPVSQVPESLATGVIEGTVVPWEVVPAIKVQELVGFHTEILGTPSLYVASFFLAMNKAKYEGMPDDLRAVLDQNSGMTFAKLAGAMWDTQAVNVRKMVAERGNVITTLDAAERARWAEATQPVHAAWVTAMAEKNIDGQKLIDAARALVAKYAA